MNLFDLTGRTAIITGGNGGLGLAMARGLAKAGANVAILARDADKNAAAVDELAPEAHADAENDGPDGDGDGDGSNVVSIDFGRKK